MTERSRLLDAAARRPIILDAGMGTRLIDVGQDGNSCLWNLTHPDVIAEIHARDLSAGADAVLTNTFGATRGWLERSGHGRHTLAINRLAVKIARQAAGPDRFVIGSIGPTAAANGPKAAANPQDYREQAEILANAGVDALVFETHLIENARIALETVRPVVPLPLIVSLFFWITQIEANVRLLEDLGASAIGGNCQVGMWPFLEMVETLKSLTRLPLWVKPSGSSPVEPPESPESFAEAVPALLAGGARFLGGCCGTTEAHVAALRAACYASP